MNTILRYITIIIGFSFTKNHCLDNINSGIKRIFQSDYSFSMSHGFFGVKTIILMQKYCKTNDEKIKDLLKCNILWNLIKFNIRFESRYSMKRSIVFSVKPFNFDYGSYFIPMGCLNEYPGPECIIRRIGCCGIGLGLEFYYNKNTSKYKFSQNLSLFINVVAKKLIPLDLILSYSPFVFSVNNGIYLELDIINFSLGNFIKGLVMAFVDLENQYKSNWLPTESDNSKRLTLKERYRQKVKMIQAVNKEKVKFILLDNFLLSIVYNIRFFIGFSGKIMT